MRYHLKFHLNCWSTGNRENNINQYQKKKEDTFPLIHQKKSCLHHIKNVMNLLNVESSVSSIMLASHTQLLTSLIHQLLPFTCSGSVFSQILNSRVSWTIVVLVLVITIQVCHIRDNSISISKLWILWTQRMPFKLPKRALTSFLVQHNRLQWHLHTN